MASRPLWRRRLLLPAVLAAILTGEITGIALARTLPPVVVPVSSPAQPASDAPALRDRSGAIAAASIKDGPAEVVRPGVDLASRGLAEPAFVPRPSVVPASRVGAVRTPVSGSAQWTGAGSPTVARTYRGTNHVWIPSLGINKGVQSFPCSRTRPPDAGVYRWGCAGRNNVYLLAHAWSTFEPLHDAYVRGTLRKGMRVWYADGAGRTHEYRVIWWRVTAPTTAASWAWAALASPGMTLQTCVGANSQYRLMVRLDRVD